MTDKWGIHKNKSKKKKGYLKIIYVAVNVKAKEILALEVTLMRRFNDGKEMKALVEHVLERNNNKNYKIKTVLAQMEHI